MGWTEIARCEQDRRGLRYGSDCTDEEWAVIAPLLAPAAQVGRPRRHRARDLWNAIQYLAATGCQWAQLPRDSISSRPSYCRPKPFGSPAVRSP
ncbi:transposase [uncultured Sphingomonas sp.]|uniref:transposase n=1 Tax=uncultured Sphingomonas sp. TaxID=158754 RepID=UPI0035CB6611